MAVRIRMKRMGRTHRPYFRVCAFDQNAPRDGRALEELGTYDPSISDTDARAVLNGERIAYWLSVGAQPTEKVAVLIKKYGKDGTHLAQQQEALTKLARPKVVPDPGKPASLPKKQEEESTPAPAEASAAETSARPETEAAQPEAATAQPEAEATQSAAAEAPAEEAKSQE